MKVVYSQEALEDLGNFLEYIAVRNPSAARAIAAHLNHTIKLIGLHPRGARYDPVRNVFGRVVTRLPLIILYVVHADHVELLAFFHTARDPNRKQRR